METLVAPIRDPWTCLTPNYRQNKNIQVAIVFINGTRDEFFSVADQILQIFSHNRGFEGSSHALMVLGAH